MELDRGTATAPDRVSSMWEAPGLELRHKTGTDSGNSAWKAKFLNEDRMELLFICCSRDAGKKCRPRIGGEGGLLREPLKECGRNALYKTRPAALPCVMMGRNAVIRKVGQA